MSAQIWSESLKHRRGGHQRQSSEFELPVEQRQSLDSQRPRKANRASIQTAFTEAPTDSIFVPASPTASSVAPQGLAPRPLSYRMAASAEPVPASSDRKPRRMPYDDNNEGGEYYFPAPARFEAPCAPNDLPMSYQQPHPPTASSLTSQPALPGQNISNFRAHTGISGDYTQSRDMPSSTSTVAAPTTGDAQFRVEDNAQSRRPSAGAMSDRRKKLATNRSPLQTLELTLDSMTKEEKRARVEAAEQRARQRAARTAQASAVPSSETRPTLDDVAIKQAFPVQRQGFNPESRTRQSEHHDWSQHIPNTASEFTQSLTQASSIPYRNLNSQNRTFRNSTAPQSLDTLEVRKQRGPPPNDAESLPRAKLGQGPKEVFTRHIGPEALTPGYVPTPGMGPAMGMGPTSGMGTVRNPLYNKRPPALPTPRNYQVEAMQRHNAYGMQGMQGIQRRATEPIQRLQYGDNERYPARIQLTPNYQAPQITTQNGMVATEQRLERSGSGVESAQETRHRLGNMLFSNSDTLKPGEGLYKPPEWLDEWNKAAVGSLTGPLLDIQAEQLPENTYKTWWEKGKGCDASRPRKAEAFDGEYDDTTEPTRFKPQLYLKCGPLLRFCGIRKEAIPSRSQNRNAVSDREIWRGSIMIVTQDSASSYEIAPMLRLFVQNIESLPPAPHHVNGELSPEFVDPIAGHPKLGRRGETLYVRPVEHLKEGKDLSRDETDNGLYEASRSPPDVPPPHGATEMPGSFASRKSRAGTDGERIQKYRDVRGFQLHRERGYTFWRFNIEVELRQKQQRIAYRINRGPCMAFWVPERNQTMNIMFHSCNGFSASVDPNDFSGPDPMWRDVLNTHQAKPFHVMIGGGDQIYNDSVANKCELFGEWLDSRNPFNKHHTLFTAEMQDQLEQFYLERYCMWFSQGLFGLAASQIPMVNMYDDHDIFDGYGSYPDHDMRSPVFSGLGAVAFKYYILFQHQSIVPETELSEPSWILGVKPGPYIQEVSRSVYVSLGGKTALLAVDTRTERTEHEVVNEKTWEKITSRLYFEMRRGQVEHLLVLLGVPIAYPRMVWLENILTSRLMDPFKALGRVGVLGKMMNKIDGGVEVLDDLNDHWTAKNHKQERSIVIEDLQDLAMDKSVRVTILSGDVHVAAVGQFYSNPQLGLAKHKDPRYMPNIVSSAIVNTPPPDILADVLNKRNKVHHFDKSTDESMIPLFQHGPDGKSRKNKRLLPHRNWCSIRQWSPGTTPPPTPPLSDDERSPSPPAAAGGGGLLRRLSFGKRTKPKTFEESRESVRSARPPISGGLLRSLPRKNSDQAVPRPTKLTRSMSLGSNNQPRAGFLGLIRRGSQSRTTEDNEDDASAERWGQQTRGSYPSPYGQSQEERLVLRGGGSTNDEYSDGDDAYFSGRAPQGARVVGGQPRQGSHDDARIRPFHRTPTGLSVKQMKNAQKYTVDLEGGLDICINVEVNPKDPTGITVPYRFLVPKLHYEYNGEEDSVTGAYTRTAEPSRGFKRLFSFRKKQQPPMERYEDDDWLGKQEGADYEDESTDAGTSRR